MSGLYDPPYENGHNFWTDAPIANIQTILKSEKAGLQHMLILGEFNFFDPDPPPLALKSLNFGYDSLNTALRAKFV